MKSVLLTFLAGALYALTYPSFIGPAFFPLLFIAIPLFLWNIEKAATLKRRLLLVLVYNLGLNVTGFYWIPNTLQEFGQLPIVVCWILGLLFSMILQPHWWFYPLWLKYRPKHIIWSKESSLMLTAFVLTIFERYVPQQFPIFAGSPWLALAPKLQLASVFGVAAFSFMTYWLSLEIIGQIERKKVRPGVLIALGIFTVLNGIPFNGSPGKEKLNVRIVQANVGNFMKVSSESGDQDSIGEINNRYAKLSLTKNDFKPDLILWPETAYPDAFFGTESKLPYVFSNILKESGAEILIGGYDQDPTKPLFEMYETVFNSSILISEDKVKTSYHKNILIPFGETLPFGPLNRKIVEFVPAVSLFAKGDLSPLMQTRQGHRFVTPICYEVLETDYMRGLLNQYGGSRLIINHTNDSWYGNTAEPYQHLFLSKWRALEFNLPIVRSTNTGVSSVIFADGSESKQLGIGEQNILDVSVPLGNGEATIYQRFGVFTFIAAFVVLFGITFLKEKKRSRP